MITTYIKYTLVSGLIATALVWHITDKNKAVAKATVSLQAEFTAAAFTASESARKRETELSVINEKITQNAELQKTRNAAAVAVTAGRLRDLKSALASVDTTSATATPAHLTDDPRNKIISECTSALVTLDEYAHGVGLQARGLQRYVGDVCLAK